MTTPDPTLPARAAELLAFVERVNTSPQPLERFEAHARATHLVAEQGVSIIRALLAERERMERALLIAIGSLADAVAEWRAGCDDWDKDCAHFVNITSRDRGELETWSAALDAARSALPREEGRDG